ncbi:MAG: FkbM family methyltransferase [Alphaproteobacteria bacterium]
MSDKVLAEQAPIRIKECRHGLFMYNIHDQYIGRSLDFYGEFSEQEAGLFYQIIQPGMTVLDIGANIGAHTVGLAKKVGNTGQVIAFEPQRVVYQMLCGNLALNNIQNVSSLMAAVGKTPGSITVPRLNYDVSGNFGGIALGNYDQGEVVPLLTLDSLQLPRCHFIKLDVEGMELEALEGAVETMKRCQPFLYVENDRRDRSEPLIRFLLAQGYRLFWHLPPLFNEKNFYGKTEDLFPTICSINMLGIPSSQGPVTMKDFVEITAENADKYITVLE